MCGKKQNKYFKEFQRGILDLKESTEKSDLCVIGSDKVFNCRIKSNWGFSTQLFGNIHNANYVITYATSCGFTKVDILNDYMKVEIRKFFENIGGFSVKDKNTYDFVRELSGRDLKIHLDPVLVGNFDSKTE